MKLLLHTCCGPCLVSVYKHLQNDFDISIFWYNHNIHPFTEYVQRRDCVRDFVAKERVSYIENDLYGLIPFTRKVANCEDIRCEYCYFERLKQSAVYAKDNGYDCFSTTLLYSKYQKHDMIKEIGEDLAMKLNIAFLYQDLRVLWQEGIRLSKECGMYRQKYCGCIYSEMERYNLKIDSLLKPSTT